MVFTLLVRLPLLPVTSLVKIGEIIQDQVNQELYDPASVQRQVEAAEEAGKSGEISAEEVKDIQEESVGRLLAPAGRSAEANGRDTRS